MLEAGSEVGQMAASNGRKKTSSSKRKTAGSAASKSSARNKKADAARAAQDRALFHEIGLIALFAAMVFFFCCNFGIVGPAGDAVSGVLFGIFGLPAYVLPLLLFFAAAFWFANTGNPSAVRKLAAGVVLFLMAGILCDLITKGAAGMEKYSIVQLYEICRETKGGGGVLAGSISYFLQGYLETIGTILVVLLCSVVSLILLTEKSLLSGVKRGGIHMREISREETIRRREMAKERRLEKEEDMMRRSEEARERRQAQEEQRRNKARERRLRMEEKENEKILRTDGTKSGSLDMLLFSRENTVHHQDDMHEIILSDEELGTGQMFDGAERSTVSQESSVDRKAAEEAGKNKVRDTAEATPPFIRIHKAEVNEDSEALPGPEPVVPDRGAVPGFDSSYTVRLQAMQRDVASAGVDSLLKMPNSTESHVYSPEPNPVDVSENDGTNDSLNSWEEAEAFIETGFAAEPENGAEAAVTAEGSDEREFNFGKQQRADTVFSTGTERRKADIQSEHNTGSGFEQSALQEEDRDAEGTPPEASLREGTRPVAVLPREGSIENGQSGRVQPEAVAPKKYLFPPISLLQKGVTVTGDSERELRETAMHLQQTLSTFGVKVTITDISQGPSVTRYELQPEQGVKVSKIVGLTDDIKLNLAAMDIRIEAPIPGKAAIGIEVPNKETMPVGLRDLLETKEFRDFQSSLAFAVGKDIAGKVVVSDIAKMPHMLIAGATGSGKSVCINTLIMSILYKAHPDDVKMIMVDPKVVELSIYNGIPHLLIPVVTDPKKASAALHWGVSEMDDRYQKFAEYGARNLSEYNKKVEAQQKRGDASAPKKLPQIVIIVDELADLMMVCPGEVEASICRLAQLARACGIHLVIATQRPSVDVITGLIKANMPSRVAFSVSSGVDSRTILDMVGAEKLLGKGDMLFYPQGYPKPARVQGAFVSDQEVSDVVDFLKNQRLGNTYANEIEEKIATIGSSAGGGEKASGGSDVDELFERAGRLIIDKDKASIGMLQRALQIGFNRAARIMDQLCQYGVVGEEEGTKPRKILMNPEQFEQLLEEVA